MGLVTGVCLAEIGHQVACVDIDAGKIEKINRGESPIYEKDLNKFLAKNLKTKRFIGTTNLVEAVRNSDITLINVGTPNKYGAVDLTALRKATQSVGEALKKKQGYHLVAVKSTVVPSTTDSVVRPILEKASGKKAGEIGLCMNPEFIREGNAILDFMNPDRIVIGSHDRKSFETMKKVYAHFSCPIIDTNLRTAEMIKYTANTLFATLISYSNEIARICEHIGGIDVEDVMRGVHFDNRFMPSKKKGSHRVEYRVHPGMVDYLKAGPGYGGSCFPKDVQALYTFLQSQKHESKILKSVIEINKTQPMRVVKRLEEKLGSLKNKKIAVWGLAFKPETDDLRESPAEPILRYLVSKGAAVTAYDPIAMANAKNSFKDLSLNFSDTLRASVKGAHAVMVLTSWSHFKNADFKKLKQGMAKGAIIVDARRIYNKESVACHGLQYLGVGLA